MAARLPAVVSLGRKDGQAAVHLPETLGIAAPNLLGDAVQEDVLELLKEGARQALLGILTRIRFETRRASEDDRDPADICAHAAVQVVDNASIGRLIADWQVLAMLEARRGERGEGRRGGEGPRRRERGEGTSSASRRGSQARAVCERGAARRAAEVARSALGRLDGRLVDHGRVHEPRRELHEALRSLDAALERDDDLPASHMADMVERLSAAYQDLQVFMGRVVGHRDERSPGAGGLGT